MSHNKAYDKKYAREHPKSSEYNRNHIMQWRYGISLEEYDGLFKKQNGQCAVCGKVSSKHLYVDHDHITGKVRGLLCRDCNLALGFVHDDPKIILKLHDYLLP